LAWAPIDARATKNDEGIAMRLSRRQFTIAAGGTLAFASTPALLKRAGLAAEEPIRVGNILDQTGGLNIYSLKQIKALAMAVDELNQAGGLLGRPLELFFYDSQSNNQFNSQYATQALVRDKVQVIHGGITSSSREVMRPIVHKYKGLLSYNSLYEGGVCDRRHISTGMVPAQQLEPLVDYVVNEKGAKKGYVLAADYNYGQITSKWMQKLLGEAGGEAVAVEFFPLDVTNFAPAISRIQAAEPDVVWSALVGGAHIAFYRQFEATIGKQNMMLASTTYGVGRENTQLSEAEREGIVIATSFVDDLPTEAAKAFVDKFKDYSGEDEYVGEYGEYGHRGLMLWAEAVRQAGDAAPDAVIAAIAKGGVTFDGAGGLYTIDGKTQHTTMDMHIAVGNRAGTFDVIKSFPQRPPRDTQEVCDLEANPDDTTQYEPEI
jgi:urea transport system substrate-binding protein